VLAARGDGDQIDAVHVHFVTDTLTGGSADKVAVPSTLGHRLEGAVTSPTSDPLDPEGCRQLVGEMAQVLDVGSEDRGLTPEGDEGEMGVDDI
jgi:hypothetical protein